MRWLTVVASSCDAQIFVMARRMLLLLVVALFGAGAFAQCDIASAATGNWQTRTSLSRSDSATSVCSSRRVV
jgi:hypothetical protein